ncbi:chaplin family protein [Streptomyces sp. 8N616]|uniref:chaplin family protein n=1 Tax=Streptomyces sp. 8N616 TaxID=3457414 RepID=UPI003FD18AE0
MRKSSQLALLAIVATALTPIASGTAFADADAKAVAANSSGILSGFIIQEVEHEPSNNCANTGSSAEQESEIEDGPVSPGPGDLENELLQVSAFNPATGNACVNASGDHHDDHRHHDKRNHGDKKHYKHDDKNHDKKNHAKHGW